MPYVIANGRRLEVLDLPARRTERPPLVLLHEGLGSISQWRGFPEAVAAATGCRTVVYSRYGHGRSDPLVGRRAVDYMHVEALETLPALRLALGLDEPVLVGHSDGASIALIHAGAAQWPLRGVAVMAPHVFVEAGNLASIAAIR